MNREAIHILEEPKKKTIKRDKHKYLDLHNREQTGLQTTDHRVSYRFEKVLY